MEPLDLNLTWLEKALQPVDPEHPETWAQGHAVLQRVLGQFRSKLHRRVPQGASHELLADDLREVILNAEDLTGWRVFLEWELHRAHPTLGEAQPGAIEQLPAPREAWALFRELALYPQAPEWEVMCRARLNFTQLPLKLLLSVLPPRSRTLRQLLLPLRKLSHDPEPFLKGLVTLVRGGLVRGRISAPLLRQLEEPLHSLVLRGKYRKHLLDPPLLERLESNPHSFPRTPEWTFLEKHRTQALQDLQQGQVNGKSWDQWLRHEADFEKHLGEVGRQLKSLEPYRSLVMTPENRYRLERWKKSPVVWSLLVLGARGAERLEWVERFPGDPRKDRLLPVVVSLLQSQLLSPSTGGVEAQNRSISAKALRKVHSWLQVLMRAGLLEQVLTSKVLSQASDSPEQHAALLRCWNLYGHKHPRLPQILPFEGLSWMLRGGSRDLAFFPRSIPSNAATHPAKEWLEPWRLKRFLRGGPEHLVFLGRVLVELRRELGKRSREWQQQLGDLPQELKLAWKRELCSKHWTPSEWKLLLEQERFWTDRHVLEDLKGFPFKHWRARRLPIPQPMLDLAAANPDFLAWAFQQHPWGFQELYRRGTPWWNLVPQVAARARLSRELEAMVDPKQIPQALDALKEHYGPNQLAALELAFHFGLSYAPFLLALSVELKLGQERELRGDECNRWYRTYPLPKRSGGTRTITAPQETLKRLQRAVLDRELNSWELHEAATGFRQGVGIVENARRHCGRPLVVNVDIKGFFPNTRFPQVLELLHRRLHGRFSPRAVRLLAVVLSYEQALPTGAPTSPALANQILKSTDAALATVAARKGVTYTRYADDLTFSSNGRGALEILPFVHERLTELGYELDPKKTNVFRKGRRQCVTGLVVNERPNWAKPLRRKLRAAVHRRTQGKTPLWHGRPIQDHQLWGLIDFLAQTQPQEAASLKAQLQTTGARR